MLFKMHNNKEEEKKKIVKYKDANCSRTAMEYADQSCSHSCWNTRSSFYTSSRCLLISSPKVCSVGSCVHSQASSLALRRRIHPS